MLSRCSLCQTVIHGKIITVDDKFVCSKCSSQSDKECGICSKVVLGDCLLSNGKYFHKNCMKVRWLEVSHDDVRYLILFVSQCAVCGDNLQGTYFTFMNKLVCEKDYKVRD